MSGMDRLTDESLRNIMSDPHWASDRDAFEMARELLAHRRASQAAPAPSDGTCAECGCAPTNVAGLCSTCVDERAPAPSDGLREALDRIAEQQQYRSGYDQTDISVEPALTAAEMQEIARAALSAPAQEGGE